MSLEKLWKENLKSTNFDRPLEWKMRKWNVVVEGIQITISVWRANAYSILIAIAAVTLALERHCKWCV